MDRQLTEELEMLRKAVREFATRNGILRPGSVFSGY